MESDHSTGQQPGRIQELERELEQLREENRILKQQRDRAVKAQDALLEKVIPLAVPGGRSQSPAPSNLSRLLTLALCVVLLVIMVLLAHYFPRIVRAVGDTKQLPPSVRIQE